MGPDPRPRGVRAYAERRVRTSPHRPPVWPARPGAQVATQHLDIWVQDLDAAVRWALRCGAVEAEVQPQPQVSVLIDPAGHPFCLFT
ncbi:VOC family protein [Sanguibacter sp. Z1732]|uniref:VOC family protein n=1 Tax=Sanguibacter sp. Z1732 TaxID=3435412 RepID=UPI003D9C9E7D